MIPEMFNKTKPTFQKILDLIISSMIKRRIHGFDYGVAIVSEGVFHKLNDDEIQKSGVRFTCDAHSHKYLKTNAKQTKYPQGPNLKNPGL